MYTSYHVSSGCDAVRLGADGMPLQGRDVRQSRTGLLLSDNRDVPSLESSIDRLYQGPLSGFVAARTALAKTLSGDDAKRVKSLEKPTAVPWAVNQVYWHARPVYDRLLKSGGAFRSAQIAALGGRAADVRGATDAQRKAVAGAVAEALRLALADGLHPDADALTQTFETLSLTVTPIAPAGRLSQPLRPAGFEALAGVTVQAPAHVRPQPAVAAKAKTSTSPPVRAPANPPLEDVRTRQRQEAEAERQRNAEIKDAQAAVVRAQAAEERARAEWERRKRDLDAAETSLARLR
jgi:hypothetical protein